MSRLKKSLLRLPEGRSDANYMRYKLIIYWSKADQSFVVEVPELPGCMADGSTYEEAVANARTVIQEWIETAQSLGRPIPEARAGLALRASIFCWALSSR